MYPNRYFGGRYFAPRYFSKVGAEIVILIFGKVRVVFSSARPFVTFSAATAPRVEFTEE